MHYTFDYKRLIKYLNDNHNNKIIGNIDLDCIDRMNVEDLMYIFPLIERLVVEIYKLVPGSIVEVNEQGIMKSASQILKDNKDNENYIFPEDLRLLIFKYYDDENSVRNKLFHVQEGPFNISYDKEELSYLIFYLLLILNGRIDLYNIDQLKKIERL